MIEIKPGRYFSQWWFLCADGTPMDVLGALFRDEGESDWQLIYRFRYYDASSVEPFDDKDEKRWYHMRVKDRDETDALKSANSVFGLLVHAGLNMHILPTRTDDPEEVIKALEREKWFHKKLVDERVAP